MKKIAFVYVGIGFFGRLSILTIINLERALNLLSREEFDFVYIAMNQVEEDRKQEAINFIQNFFINSLPSPIQCKIYVSDSNGSYEVKFVEYLHVLPFSEVYVDVFSNIYHKEVIKNTPSSESDLTHLAINRK